MVQNTKLNHVPTCKDKNGRIPSAALATILTDCAFSMKETAYHPR